MSQFPEELKQGHSDYIQMCVREILLKIHRNVEVYFISYLSSRLAVFLVPPSPPPPPLPSPLFLSPFFLPPPPPPFFPPLF